MRSGTLALEMWRRKMSDEFQKRRPREYSAEELIRIMRALNRSWEFQAAKAVHFISAEPRAQAW
jgi:hypothetical protein